jgi:hypothetical protein
LSHSRHAPFSLLENGQNGAGVWVSRNVSCDHELSLERTLTPYTGAKKMTKPSKLASIKSKSTSKGMPFVVLVGLVGFGLLGYVVSQMFLPVEAHPSHWLIALIGAALGGVLGWLWYRWRGDII